MTIKITGEMPAITISKTEAGLLIPGDERKECCAKEENLEHWEQNPNPNTTVYRCKICGCRHFNFDAEPGKIGLR